MSDDNLPEDPTQPVNETETTESSMLPRRARGNRRDEEEGIEPDNLDKLRERVSSPKSLMLAIGFIIVAAIVAGLINQEDGPAEVDDAWDTVNVAIAKIREVTTNIEAKIDRKANPDSTRPKTYFEDDD